MTDHESAAPSDESNAAQGGSPAGAHGESTAAIPIPAGVPAGVPAQVLAAVPIVAEVPAGGPAEVPARLPGEEPSTADLAPELTLAPAPATRRSSTPSRALMRSAGAMLLFLVGVAVVWEGFKALFGDPWRYPQFGIDYHPPFHLLQASDLQLPHIWSILGALANPVQRSSDQSLGQFLVGAALFTWREALLGFLIGTLVGISLATIFVHSRLAERAFVPYVIASQTIPIVALAPLIVVGLGRGIVSIVFIAIYLTFFPVTIAEIRGLRSPDPRSLELMRSYAASRWSIFWKVRLPASVPYLFSALKVAATASVVGTIIGEDPGGAADGLGRAIVNFNQQYITGPEKLWATILVASLLGMAFYLVVRIIEVMALRGRRAAEA